jgi:hypothetical protein
MVHLEVAAPAVDSLVLELRLYWKASLRSFLAARYKLMIRWAAILGRMRRKDIFLPHAAAQNGACASFRT